MISNALFIRKEFQLSTGGESLVTAIALLGAMIGAALAGGPVGRRWTVFGSVSLFVVGVAIGVA